MVGGGALPFISGLGVCFILYLAWKVAVAEVETRTVTPVAAMDFKDGLFMQLLNPKAFMVVLPVTTVQFPAVGIHEGWVAIWSICLGAMSVGAPMSYALIGAMASRRIGSTKYFQYFNYLMAVMLFIVAVDMAYEHVYPALAG